LYVLCKLCIVLITVGSVRRRALKCAFCAGGCRRTGKQSRSRSHSHSRTDRRAAGACPCVCARGAGRVASGADRVYTGCVEDTAHNPSNLPADAPDAQTRPEGRRWDGDKWGTRGVQFVSVHACTAAVDDIY